MDAMNFGLALRRASSTSYTCTCQGCGATATFTIEKGADRFDSRRCPEMKGWATLYTMVAVPITPKSKHTHLQNRERAFCPACAIEANRGAHEIAKWKRRHAAFLKRLVRDVALPRAKAVAWLQANPPPPSVERNDIDNAYSAAVREALGSTLPDGPFPEEP